MARFCTECGATLSDDKKFCTECGTPVTASEEVNTEQPEAGSAQAAIQPEETPAQMPQSQPAYQQDTQIPPVQPVYQQAPPAQPVYQAPPIQQAPPPVYGADVAPAKGSKYDPVTTGGYIGIMLLMCIPIVGLVLMIVWACGGCKKVNKRNLARASLIMMAIGLIFSLIIGFAAKSLFSAALEAAGLGGLQSESESSLFGGEEDGTQESSSSDLGALGDLAGILGGLSGESNSNVTNSDIQELEELSEMLEGLEGVTGEDYSGLSDLAEGAAEANREAEALNDGWPATLRPYPGGTAAAVASYRTEISDTTLEEMMGWIEDLKGDGFEFQDFYDFGMSEQDMLDMNGWWAYDGNTYLSVSFYEGVVTIDHTKELPDLESYFGG